MKTHIKNINGYKAIIAWDEDAQSYTCQSKKRKKAHLPKLTPIT